MAAHREGPRKLKPPDLRPIGEVEEEKTFRNSEATQSSSKVAQLRRCVVQTGNGTTLETKEPKLMAISILNNIASLTAQNQLAVTQSNLNKTLFQLSSGSRINSGADDAAGLAIADGLHANITALTQSAQNANSGVGALQVADGSLAQVTQLLNRAVTLATESSNGTVSNQQRTAIQAEYAQITAEIDRIGSKTNYNGTPVFTNANTNIFLSDGASNSTITVGTSAVSSASLGLVAGTVTQTVAATSAVGHIDFSGTGPAAADAIVVGAPPSTFQAAAPSTAGSAPTGVLQRN